MWRLLIGCLCIGQIVWAQNPSFTSAKPPTTTTQRPPIPIGTNNLDTNYCVNFKCPSLPTTCKDVVNNTVRLVKAVLSCGAEVLCDTETDKGGWTIIQRRYDGSQSFYLDFADYVNGFGQLDGEFWLGLKLIHEMTCKRCYELRVDMVYKGIKSHAQYSYFKVYGPEDNYRLKIGVYLGDAGDALRPHDSQQFSTKDQDNDKYSGNCAQSYTGAWWYTSCHAANLNGEWGSKSYGKGLNWRPVTGYYDSVTLSEMKIRPCS